jgi:hypothetical protein
MPEGAPASSLEVINDAIEYDVTITPARVVPGQTFWKVILVHHLTPEENRGGHNIFVDVIDENDQRVYGTRIQFSWQTGSGIGIVDKPPNEPGTNFPMWKNQICEIEVANGLASDRVVGLHVNHPDEDPPNNSIYHHSFLVIFKKTYYDGPIQQDNGVIEGVVKGGAGEHVILLQNDEVVARTAVDDEEHYRFEKLLAGTYTVEVEGTTVSVRDIEVDGYSVLVVDMDLGTDDGTGAVIDHYVLFGSKDAPGTQTNFVLAQDYILRDELACGFSVEEALRARQVTIMGDVQAVSEEEEASLIEAGVQVRRISGDSYAVEEILSQLS